MTPELRDLWQELRETGEDAEELAGGLEEAQLWWRPAADRWSVGECLDHLVRTDEEYLVVLDDAIREGREAGRTSPGPYRRTFLGRWIAKWLEPPPSMRVPAPRIVRPRRPEAPSPKASDAEESPVDRFLALRPRLARRLAAADGLDLGRLRVTSPFVPLLRVDLGSAFRLVTAHERRHLWQARQVTEEEGFPS